jgi:hypothetical protein
MKLSLRISLYAGKKNWCYIGHTGILIYNSELEKPRKRDGLSMRV